MEFKNSLTFAIELDEQDPLKELGKEFVIPQRKGADAVYLCGNSLGLQPIAAQTLLEEQLTSWKNLGVEGWFKGNTPWLNYQQQLLKPLAAIVGAQQEEITVMNSLTVNLHLLMVSFYKPKGKRFKILMEGGAFPSDQYAIESQVNFHGYNAKDAIIEVFPRAGEYTLRTEDIIDKINENANELTLVLFSGVNYYTGQFFDLQKITEAAHKAGAYAGFDLAHAAGNVPLKLHDWNVDFACWCSYKYMNSGPGGISGIFVHQNHFENTSLSRFAGWWGYRADKRFLMTREFEAAGGAEGWQVSTSPIFLLTIHKAALTVFEKVGDFSLLREKSEKLTAYLEFLISGINSQNGEELFKIITPAAIVERGCQLSIICKRNGKATFNYLEDSGVIGDWREPNVIRLAPVPLYNSFKDVYLAAQCLRRSVESN